MPRHMSFSMTTEAVRRGEKTVTRRLGWWDLKPGTVLWAVEKSQGLKKGEKVKKLALIRVVDVSRERLHWVVAHWGSGEMVREGFPDLSPYEFVEKFMLANRCGPGTPVNRIEFEYVEGER